MCNKLAGLATPLYCHPCQVITLFNSLQGTFTLISPTQTMWPFPGMCPHFYFYKYFLGFFLKFYSHSRIVIDLATDSCIKSLWYQCHHLGSVCLPIARCHCSSRCNLPKEQLKIFYSHLTRWQGEIVGTNIQITKRIKKCQVLGEQSDWQAFDLGIPWLLPPSDKLLWINW